VALDWSKLKRLDFEKGVDQTLSLPKARARSDEERRALPCALNAADEVAVAAFLERKLPFLGIPEVVEKVLGRMPRLKLQKMDDVLSADAEARRMAKEEVAALTTWRRQRRRRERRSERLMNTVLGIVLVLGVMILVHEWGHLSVARLFGVRVDVFSIGFGPRLFGWKRGATDYRLARCLWALCADGRAGSFRN